MIGPVSGFLGVEVAVGLTTMWALLQMSFDLPLLVRTEHFVVVFREKPRGLVAGDHLCVTTPLGNQNRHRNKPSRYEQTSGGASYAPVDYRTALLPPAGVDHPRYRASSALVPLVGWQHTIFNLQNENTAAPTKSRRQLRVPKRAAISLLSSIRAVVICE